MEDKDMRILDWNNKGDSLAKRLNQLEATSKGLIGTDLEITDEEAAVINGALNMIENNVVTLELAVTSKI